MPTIFTVPSLSLSPSPRRKSPPATFAIPVRSSFAVSGQRTLTPSPIPGVLVAGHAPFAWGKTPAEAVEHADVLEYIARLAFHTILLNPAVEPIASHVSEHHYQRKHGSKATYGQC